MSKNSHDNNKNNVRIHEDAKEFSKLSFKKYKKKYGSDYDRKKECQTGFYLYLFDLLPRTIEFCVKYGYINDPEIQEVKNGIYAKIVDEDFVKYLKKEIKGGNKIENIKWMPIIISDILKQTNKQNTEMLAQDPNAKIYDMSDLVELSQIILKKKLKKFNKFAIENNIEYRKDHGWDDFDFSLQILSKGLNTGHIPSLTYISDVMEPDKSVANVGNDKWTEIGIYMYKTWGDSIKFIEKKGQVNAKPQRRIIEKKLEKGIPLTNAYYEDCYRDIINNHDVAGLKKLIVEDKFKTSRSSNFDWSKIKPDATNV